MFNVTIFRIKDIVKYLFCLAIIMIIVYVANRYFFSHKNESKSINLGKMLEEKVDYLIDMQYPQIKTVSNSTANETIEEIDEEDFYKDFFEGLIKSEISIADTNVLNSVTIVGDSDKKENQNTQKDSSNLEISNENNKEDLTTDSNMDLSGKTTVVTKNPISDAYTQTYNGVKIKNETSFNLTDDILNPEDLKINNKDVLIFHTHTCESYTESDAYPYTPTGNYRTTDNNYSVVRVGDELQNQLSAYGINVEHDKTYHDYPSYTGSYKRSLSTVQGLLNNKSYDIIIDLHRDAIGSRPDYAPTVQIGEEYAAQIMFVMGSNGGGLYHPNWSSNLKYAVKVQEKANELYPGLFKPIILRNSRYNQHLSQAACIIEVGSTGNTLEQCLTSMKYLAYILSKIE